MTEDTVALMEGRYDVHTNFTYSFEDPDYFNKEREGCIDEDIEKVPGLGKIIAGKRAKGVELADDEECEEYLASRLRPCVTRACAPSLRRRAGSQAS